MIFNAKTNANPESSVGLMSMGGKGPEVLVTLTTDLGKVLDGMHRTKIWGTGHLSTGIAVAALALKHRQNKSQRQRIVVFTCSPLLDHDEKSLIKLARRMKKTNVSIDFVAFGDVSADTKTKLEAFNENIKGGEGSHVLFIPPGPRLLSDVLINSPILAADGAGGSGGGGGGVSSGAGGDVTGANGTEAGAAAGTGSAAGGAGGAAGAGGIGSGFEFGIDPSLDPELAMALRMSMEEETNRLERHRLEREQQQQPQGPGSNSKENEDPSRLQGIPEEGVQTTTGSTPAAAQQTAGQVALEGGDNTTSTGPPDVAVADAGAGAGADDASRSQAGEGGTEAGTEAGTGTSDQETKVRDRDRDRDPDTSRRDGDGDGDGDRMDTA